MKFVTKVEITRNFYIARSSVRGDYLIRVNGGSIEKLTKWTTKWSLPNGVRPSLARASI